MNIHLVRNADYVAQRWKNGGGTTTQIAVDTNADADAARWRWRASVADVEQSGPFSDFTGFERSIMLIEGDGMLLSFADGPAQRIDTRFVAFTFDGGAKTDCRLLGGPVRDLNLMVDRTWGRGIMRTLALNHTTVPITLRGESDLLYCAAGSADTVASGGRVALAAGDTLRADAGATRTLLLHNTAGADTTIIHMSVEPL